MTGERTSDLRAAGVVAFRPGHEVLLVHRPRYGDWSFPKGKLDRGEHAVAAAVREAYEETGVDVRLARPLSDQRYPIAGGRSKLVHYWTARCVGGDDVSTYAPNAEIDDVRWVSVAQAEEQLTYDRDRDTLGEAVRHRTKTHAIIVLRHAESRSRRVWGSADAERPLLQRGFETADRLVPLLAAYDVTRVLSSTSTRCVQTVQPYAETDGQELETRRRLSEEGATTASVRRVVDGLLEGGRGAVLCTHRPVLPLVFDALGIDAPSLEPGEMVVTHVRKGRVRGVERHCPR